jgi:hypothetical protein
MEIRDEHERALAEQPAAHADVGLEQGLVQSFAAARREEREHPVVGVFALQQKVDGEDDAGDDFEEPAGPGADGGDEIGGEVGRVILQPGVECGDIES